MKQTAELGQLTRVRPRDAWASVLLGVAILTCYPAAASAELTQVKIGLLRSMQNSGVFIAQERGYFAAEGLATSLVLFNGAQPIPEAVASHNVDFGVAGTTASLYRLGNAGALRIIAGAAHEAAGYHLYGLAVSRHAYQAGLKTYKDLPGHSVAISTFGAPAHYSLALIAKRYGFDLTDVRVTPLQSYAEMVLVVSNGHADAGIMPATEMTTAISNGTLQIIGWIGNEVPWQVSVIFTATEFANENRDTVARFLRAYRRGAREYYDALAGADGARKDGPSVREILSIIAQYLGHTAEQIKTEVSYIDPDGRLDVNDILQQIGWYRAQGLLDGPEQHLDEEIIDKRYVIPLIER